MSPRWAGVSALALALLVPPAGGDTGPASAAPSPNVGDGVALLPITPEVAASTYERLASMAGEWTGVSTKGWSGTMAYTVIARGSCVLERSFDAHPGETMLTLYHMDGERLMLTHYCVAQNQPRLVARRGTWIASS